MRPATTILALTGLFTACEGQPGAETPVVPETEQPVSLGAVQASFQAGPWSGGEQTVWIRLMGVEGQVGAYQGRAEFDATRLALLSAEMTDGEGTPDFGIVNADSEAPGLVRFAGFSVQGFAVRDVVALRFKTSRPLVAGDVRLTLDVVGTAEGTEIAADELSVVSALQPLTKLEIGR